VLAAAPSNIAVDNLAEQLIRAGVKVVRIGHPARIMEAAQAVSLDALVDASDEAALVRDVRKEMNAISKQLSGKPKRRGAGDGGADGKRGLRQEFRALRKELRQRESVSIREVLRRVEVVLGTTSGLVRTGPIGLLPPDHFDVSVVDEAGQALEVACWTVLLRAPRCVLAGDHLQLPPTITSPEASKGGLQVTLLERAVSVLGGDGVCLLDTQYVVRSAV
jgi:ATP-dependent RNA/DNA helicase IGHMBP2